MRNVFSIAIVTFLLLMPLTVETNAEEMMSASPPVGQSLVREGDFAVRLVEALDMGTVEEEAEAQDLLASVGIAPRNGWISDYPMTPDTTLELRNSVVLAADSGQLKMSGTEAARAFEAVTAEFGLPVYAAPGQEYGQDYAYGGYQYPDQGAIEDYYVDEGPPIVTYYPPPWDYNYLYSWVPYPFWWGGFGFSGYYILNDFHKVVIVDSPRHRKRVKKFSNYAVNKSTRRLHRIDPTRRVGDKSYDLNTRRDPRRRGYAGNVNQAERERSAASILRRNYERNSLSRSGRTMNERRARAVDEPGRTITRGSPEQVRQRAINERRASGSNALNRGTNSSKRLRAARSQTQPRTVQRSMSGIQNANRLREGGGSGFVRPENFSPESFRGRSQFNAGRSSVNRGFGGRENSFGTHRASGGGSSFRALRGGGDSLRAFSGGRSGFSAGRSGFSGGRGGFAGGRGAFAGGGRGGGGCRRC